MPHRWIADMVEIRLIEDRIEAERMIEHSGVCPWLTTKK